MRRLLLGILMATLGALPDEVPLVAAVDIDIVGSSPTALALVFYSLLSIA
jgi:hypothetical protein